MSRLIPRSLPTVLSVLTVAGALAGSAQAATTQHGSKAGRANVAGTYNGRIDQLLPKLFTGHIHFVIGHGRLTALKFTAGTLCGVMWASDTDRAVPSFSVRIRSGGSFSYKGKVGGRTIRLRGAVSRNKAHGTFFQAFPTGSLTCTMVQAASFTATRQATGH